MRVLNHKWDLDPIDDEPGPVEVDEGTPELGSSCSVEPGLAPGWYLTRGHEAATSSQTLMTGVSLNGLNTWDVDSLGWVKLGPGGRLVTQSMDQLGRYFVPRSVTEDKVNILVISHAQSRELCHGENLRSFYEVYT